MAKYIERSAGVAILRAKANMAVLMDAAPYFEKAAQMLEKLPAADVAPVVHGQWGTARFNLETGNYEKQCTRCRNFSKEYGKPYCPNCGAKMDGGADHDA